MPPTEPRGAPPCTTLAVLDDIALAAPFAPAAVTRKNVLIVDDSAISRNCLSRILKADPALAVIGAADPLCAQGSMAYLWPDVIVLDLDLPMARMGGLDFLRRIMAERPTPVVVSFTERGPRAWEEALAAGAVAAIYKPATGIKTLSAAEGRFILETVQAAALAKTDCLNPLPVIEGPAAWHGYSPDSYHSLAGFSGAISDRVVAIGASTGGVQALGQILTQLPMSAAGVVVALHMMPGFIKSYAARLDGRCEIDVREAQDGDILLRGTALIAPGGKHMTIHHERGQYQVRILEDGGESHFRPSVDLLFHSVSRMAGKSSLGILLTGMGADGAAGLKEMRAAGAVTVAQDEATSLIYGMPRAAMELGAAKKSLPLHRMAQEIIAFA